MLQNVISNEKQPNYKENESLDLFLTYVTKAYFGIKYYNQYLELLIKGMHGSSLPCFPYGDTSDAIKLFNEKYFFILIRIKIFIEMFCKAFLIPDLLKLPQEIKYLV